MSTSGTNIDYSLYLVTDSGMTGDRDIVDVIWQAVEGGCSMIQLREKNMPEDELIEHAQRIKKLLDQTDATFIINDALKVAAACKADGVHLGQSDTDPVLARKILGPDAIIGWSVETMDQARKAENLPVDYLGVSPIFSTPTKTDTGTPWGLEGLKKLSTFTCFPLVAIGGINSDNASSVIKAGADGIAVVSAICGSFDPKCAARNLRRQVAEARAQIRNKYKTS